MEVDNRVMRRDDGNPYVVLFSSGGTQTGTGARSRWKADQCWAGVFRISHSTIYDRQAPAYARNSTGLQNGIRGPNDFPAQHYVV